jgi:hypothetical protein
MYRLSTLTTDRNAQPPPNPRRRRYMMRRSLAICVGLVLGLALTPALAGDRKGGEGCVRDSDCIDNTCERKSSSDAKGTCVACPKQGKDYCHPPGQCSESDLSSMERDKDSYCTGFCGQFSKDEKMSSCAVLKEKETQAERCADRRQKIMAGDGGHEGGATAARGC